MVKRVLDYELDRAIEAFNPADFAAAIGILRDRVAKAPSDGEAWLQLGLCYLETRQPVPAVEALARAVIAEPCRATGHIFLGTAYGASGELERASACFRRALEMDPSHAEAERLLIRAESILESRAHYHMGLRLLYSAQPSVADLNWAVRELLDSAAFFENSPARNNLRECSRKFLLFKSEIHVPGVDTPEQARWFAACHRGYACWQEENWTGARDAYLEALGEGSTEAFVFHALGFCFLELSRSEAAAQSWLRVLEIDPAYDFSHFGRLVPYR